MFGGGVLLLLPLLIGVVVIRLTSHRYLSLTKASAVLGAHLRAEQATALEQRVARMRSFRRTGGVLGVLAIAAGLLALKHTLTVSLVAVLAGVCGGSVIGEYLLERPGRRSVRSATLSRRRLATLAGRPLLLMLGLSCASDAVMITWQAVLTGRDGRIDSVNFVQGVCMATVTHPPALRQALLDLAIPAGLLAIGLLAAVSATRRPDDPRLPGPVDRELRSATVRFGLGSPSALAWLGAAVTSAQLGSHYDTGCGVVRHSFADLGVAVLVIGFGLLAFNCLVRYLLRPVRPLQSAETVTSPPPGRVSPAG